MWVPINVWFLSYCMQMLVSSSSTLDDIVQFVWSQVNRLVSADLLKLERSFGLREFTFRDLSPDDNVHCGFGESDFQEMLIPLAISWMTKDDVKDGERIIITPSKMRDLFDIGYTPSNHAHTRLLIQSLSLVIPSSTFFYYLECVPDVLLPLGLARMLPSSEVEGTCSDEMYPEGKEFPALMTDELILLISSLIPSIVDVEMFYDGNWLGRNHDEGALMYALEVAYRRVPFRFPSEKEIRANPPNTTTGYSLYIQYPHFYAPDGSFSPNVQFGETVLPSLELKDPSHQAILKHYSAGGNDHREQEYVQFVETFKAIYGDDAWCAL